MTYPAIKPTTRQFTPPIFPVTNISTMNNRSSRLLMANKPGQGSLSLGYENLSDTEAAAFSLFYESCNGSFVSFPLPATLVSGLGPELISYVQASGSGLSWKWDQPPTIEFVKKGIVNVSVTLKSYISPGTLVAPTPAPVNTYNPVDTPDLTKYPSFDGSVINPPTPPIPKNGKKWIAYSPVLAAQSRHGAPVADPFGNVYYARGINGALAIAKLDSAGNLLWRKVYKITLSTGYYEAFPSNGNPSYQNDETQLYLINDSYILIHSRLCTQGSIDIGGSSFAWIGINFDGSTKYAKRYAPVPFGFINYFWQRMIVYNPVTNCIVAVPGGSDIRYYGAGNSCMTFNVETGEMLQFVKISYANGSNIEAGPTGVTIKPNGNIVCFCSYSYPRITYEIDSGLEEVTSGIRFDGVNPSNGTYRPDTGGFLCLTDDGFYGSFLYLDESFQIIEKKRCNLIGSGARKPIYMGEGNYLICSQAGSAVENPYGRGFVKVNYTNNYVERMTYTTGGYDCVNPANNIAFITQSTNYTYIAKVSLELSSTPNTLYTETPPGLRVGAYSIEEPASPITNLSNNDVRYVYPLRLDNIGAYGSLSFALEEEFAFFEYDIISDV